MPENCPICGEGITPLNKGPYLFYPPGLISIDWFAKPKPITHHGFSPCLSCLEAAKKEGEKNGFEFGFKMEDNRFKFQG